MSRVPPASSGVSRRARIVNGGRPGSQLAAAITRAPRLAATIPMASATRSSVTCGLRNANRSVTRPSSDVVETWNRPEPCRAATTRSVAASPAAARNVTTEVAGGGPTSIPGVAARRSCADGGEIEHPVQLTGEGGRAVEMQREPDGGAAERAGQLRAALEVVRQALDPGHVPEVGARTPRAPRRSAAGSRTRIAATPYGRNSPLCASTVIESARSMPASRVRPRSVRAKNPP